MIAAVVFLAAFTQKFVEQVKEGFNLTGYAVTGVAIASGLALSFGFCLEMFGALLADYGVAPEVWVDKLFTGVTIGLSAGLVNDIAGR